MTLEAGQVPICAAVISTTVDGWRAVLVLGFGHNHAGDYMFLPNGETVATKFCIAQYERLTDAQEAVKRAQAAENLMRGPWQAAIEHEQRLCEMMRKAAYQAAQPLV